MWTLRSLIDHSETTTTELNGKWVPLRPINYKYRPMGQRLAEAWDVFIGKAEPFTWPEGQ